MAIVREPNEWAKKVKAMGHKILVIGQPISGQSVHKLFYLSALNVISAGNLNTLLDKYQIQTQLHIGNDFPIDYNRNVFVDTALDVYLADYLFFMDTDQTFPSNCILQMMETLSDEYPVVTGMYYKKADPFNPVVGRYSDWDEKSQNAVADLQRQRLIREDDNRQCLWWNHIAFFDKDVPFPVDAFGMGCLLAKAEVFRKLERPYFKYMYDPSKGDQALNSISEDMWFCAQLFKNRIKTLCDPRVQCTHFTFMESTVDLYENLRDTSLETTRQLKPELYQEIMSKVVDVRQEQKKRRDGDGLI